MNINGILIATGVIGGLGLLFGLVLGVASKIFEVQTDERIAKIMEILPCANCGGCGFPGCSAFAEAVTAGRAKPSSCSVGGADCASGVAEIMGVEASFERKAARVKCKGDCEKSPLRYEFKGVDSCSAADRMGGGPKSCSYGCMGIGSCVKACDYGAIYIVNGVSVINQNKCTACGKCVKTCPKNLIEIIPVSNEYYVACMSEDKGGEMKNTCSIGCIGCKICEKACKADAIKVDNNIAKIDYIKCTSCGACAEVCPRKIIYKI